MDYLTMYKQMKAKAKKETETETVNETKKSAPTMNIKHSVQDETTTKSPWPHFKLDNIKASERCLGKQQEAFGSIYIPSFINKEEEKLLLKMIYSKASQEEKWVKLRKRRLKDYNMSSMPQYLKTIMNLILHLFPKDKPPNHCLLNEYLPGQGIMPHEDGPAYFPMVCTISLESSCELQLYDKSKSRVEPSQRLHLEDRSLLCFSGKMYKDVLHGINAVNERRISLTFRHKI